MMDVLHYALECAKRAGADSADAMLVSEKGLSTSIRLGKRENHEKFENIDFGIRVLCNQRQAVVSGSDLQAVPDMVQKAVSMTQWLPEDLSVGLAAPDQLAKIKKEEICCDNQEIDLHLLEEIAKRAESEALLYKNIINSEGASADYNLSRTYYAASNGFCGITNHSHYSVAVAVVSGNHDSMEVDSEFSSAVFFNDLFSPETIGRKAAQRAVARLSPRVCPSGVCPVIFDPRVSRSVVKHILSAANGFNVATKKSFLTDMEGKKIASSITVCEDPHRFRGFASRLFDAEGLPTVKKNIVDRGILKTFILDLSSARRLNKQSTGNATRHVGSIPYPSVTNAYLMPGVQTVETMIKSINKGLLVTDLLGLGVNLTTGDYSRGACGFWIENGTIAYPVNKVTLASKLQDMLQTIQPASDLMFLYGVDSPSIFIDGVSVAGG